MPFSQSYRPSARKRSAREEDVEARSQKRDRLWRERRCFLTVPVGHVYRATNEGRECVGCGKRQRFVVDGGGCGWETVR